VDLPYWVWILLVLWCGPGIYCTVDLLLQKPIKELPDEGEPIKPLPLRGKIMLFPFLLVLLIATWPLVVWTEMNESRKSVKIMMFPIECVGFVATWPFLLWRELRQMR